MGDKFRKQTEHIYGVVKEVTRILKEISQENTCHGHMDASSQVPPPLPYIPSTEGIISNILIQE